jgi:hypothetical protein
MILTIKRVIMKALKLCAIISIIIGAISFFWLILDYLALTDIWHGELNPHDEWMIVTYGFIPHVLFYISVTITFIYLFSMLRKSKRI